MEIISAAPLQRRAAAGIAALSASVLGGGLVAILAAHPLIRVSYETVGVTLALGIVVTATAVLVRLAARAHSGAGLISGLSVVSFFFLCTFGLRPLYLYAGGVANTSYVHPVDSFRSLNALQSQEIVLFFATRGMSFDRSSMITVGLGFAFFAATLIGYALNSQRRSHKVRPTETVAVSRPRRVFLPGAALTMMGVSLICQARVVTKVGGVGAAANSLITQQTLDLPFYYYVGISAGPAALCFFYATRRRLFGAARLFFLLALAEETLFEALTGSRSRALVPLGVILVVAHLSRRRFRTRRVLTVAFVVLALASVFLMVREATQRTTFSSAASSVLHRPPDLGILMNDNSTFDAAVEAVALGPRYLHDPPGGRLASGLAAAVPSALYGSHKPETTDVWFRKRVWGDRFGGGRPISLVGETWLDFGVAGVLVAGVVLGAALCSLDLAIAAASRRDSPMRRVFIALLVVLLWTLLGGGVSLFTGQVLLYGIPLVMASLLLLLSTPRNVEHY